MSSDSRSKEIAALKKQLEGALVIGVIGVIYYIWVRVTGLGLPCMFRKLTGWLCPGCGMTTLVISVLGGDFKAARAANPFIYYTWPVILIELIWNEIKTIKSDEWAEQKVVKRIDVVMNVILGIYVASFIAFGVLRNVPSDHFVMIGQSLH